jgi:hypothetical protein
MDTVGTYAVELTCDKPMSFYRYYETGGYTVEHNVCHLNIEVMPSYQKLQNDRWNQYLQENENYMNNVQAYIAQSKVEADNTKTLAKMSAAIAIISIMLNVFTLPRTRRNEHRKLLLFACIGLYAVLIIVLFMS